MSLYYHRPSFKIIAVKLQQQVQRQEQEGEAQGEKKNKKETKPIQQEKKEVPHMLGSYFIQKNPNSKYNPSSFHINLFSSSF